MKIILNICKFSKELSRSIRRNLDPNWILRTEEMKTNKKFIPKSNFEWNFGIPVSIPCFTALLTIHTLNSAHRLPQCALWQFSFGPPHSLYCCENNSLGATWYMKIETRYKNLHTWRDHIKTFSVANEDMYKRAKSTHVFILRWAKPPKPTSAVSLAQLWLNPTNHCNYRTPRVHRTQLNKTSPITMSDIWQFIPPLYR